MDIGREIPIRTHCRFSDYEEKNIRNWQLKPWEEKSAFFESYMLMTHLNNATYGDLSNIKEQK